MKTYKTKPRTLDDQDLIKFKVDGDVFTARRPKDTVWADLIAASAADDTALMLLEIGRFFNHVLNESDARTFNRRLRDYDDNLDLTLSMEIFQNLVEQWTARPTGSQPDS